MSRQLFSASFLFLFIILLSQSSHADSGKRTELSDDQVAQVLIQQSISSYPGPCACPYNTMRNGRSCGARSAYSKPGGYAPLCYRTDVSEDQIKKWRKTNN